MKTGVHITLNKSVQIAILGFICGALFYIGLTYHPGMPVSQKNACYVWDTK